VAGFLEELDLDGDFLLEARLLEECLLEERLLEERLLAERLPSSCFTSFLSSAPLEGFRRGPSFALLSLININGTT